MEKGNKSKSGMKLDLIKKIEEKNILNCNDEEEEERKEDEEKEEDEDEEEEETEEEEDEDDRVNIEKEKRENEEIENIRNQMKLTRAARESQLTEKEREREKEKEKGKGKERGREKERGKEGRKDKGKEKRNVKEENRNDQIIEISDKKIKKAKNENMHNKVGKDDMNFKDKIDNNFPPNVPCTSSQDIYSNQLSRLMIMAEEVMSRKWNKILLNNHKKQNFVKVEEKRGQNRTEHNRTEQIWPFDTIGICANCVNENKIKRNNVKKMRIEIKKM